MRQKQIGLRAHNLPTILVVVPSQRNLTGPNVDEASPDISDFVESSRRWIQDPPL